MPDARADVYTTAFDAHGGPDGRAVTLMDFSVNANPFGPPEALLATLNQVDVSVYPDPTSRLACEAIAARHGVSTSNVLLGNGTAELIHRVAACYLQPGTRVLVVVPTFGEYARASALYGARVVRVNAYGGVTPDVQVVLDAIKQVSPTLVWVCQPNNPTGHAWTPDALDALAAACAQQDSLLCVDAAYLSMSTLDPYVPAHALQLRSLTKSFCVPGLRVGYALASKDVTHALARVAAPWQASAHAQHAARWAMTDAADSFLTQTIPALLKERDRFLMNVQTTGMTLSKGHSSYFLLHVTNAAKFKQQAELAGFRVRDCSSFGLPKRVRIATRLPAQNDAFVAFLQAQVS